MAKATGRPKVSDRLDRLESMVEKLIDRLSPPTVNQNQVLTENNGTNTQTAKPPRSGREIRFQGNTFVDTKTDHQELLQSENPQLVKLYRAHTEGRPAPKKVQVVCSKCGKSEKVHPILAPKNLGDRGDEPTNYVCNDCCTGRGR